MSKMQSILFFLPSFSILQDQKFYKKNGYKTIGDAFNIDTAGMHYVMYKSL